MKILDDDENEAWIVPGRVVVRLAKVMRSKLLEDARVNGMRTLPADVAAALDDADRIASQFRRRRADIADIADQGIGHADMPEEGGTGIIAGMSTDAAAKLIGVSGRHVRRLFVDGVLDGHRSTSGIRITEESVAEYRSNRMAS